MSAGFGEGSGPGRPSGPEPFVTGYRAHQGDLMVYGGGMVTVLGVLATVVQVNPSFLVLSLLGSLSAFYFWPTLDMRAPQLGADMRGVFVARIGVIRWDAIKSMKVEWRALRTMQLVTLVITIDRPLPEALAYKDKVSPLRWIAARNARVSGRTIKVTLHTLAMDPAIVEERLNALRTAAKFGS
ncbi:hypothetical protein [Acuticoccus kandeliae]|uniref:hypothetical protein n=1 Tax=Acuticoccus kandeliae TaxID=2073160 RepID=UPI0013005BF6|nr:hypothetical protein [Acuticoccus kandeliae]